ncbi:Hypp907 [Branchiostoma lanceolatum]|uniref:Hypp907 protein n=1 Tax=Branchiostoma lanceolatum TaxID=7740 RepID=A0A8J9ZEI7_BRALA|nr:Hypp907 [Branchiostoma lanceolatum]
MGKSGYSSSDPTNGCRNSPSMASVSQVTPRPTPRTAAGTVPAWRPCLRLLLVRPHERLQEQSQHGVRVSGYSSSDPTNGCRNSPSMASVSQVTPRPTPRTAAGTVPAWRPCLRLLLVRPHERLQEQSQHGVRVSGYSSSDPTNGCRNSPSVPRKQTVANSHRQIRSITMATYCQSPATCRKDKRRMTVEVGVTS